MTQQYLHRFDPFYLFNRLGDDETQVFFITTTYVFNASYIVRREKLQASRGTEMMRDCKQAKLRWMYCHPQPELKLG